MVLLITHPDYMIERSASTRTARFLDRYAR